MKARTGALVNRPYQLVTKNNKIWTLKNAQAAITYTEQHNKRKGTYKAKLTYKFLGDLPAKVGVFLQMPATP